MSLCNKFNFLPNGKILDLSKLGTFCRRQNIYESKIKICFCKDRKHYGKRRKCWLPAFSPFPVTFSKGFFVRVVKVTIMWQRVNPFPFPHDDTFGAPGKQAF